MPLLEFPWTRKPPPGVSLDPRKKDDIVALYALNEAGGDQARDLSGDSHHGTLINNPVWTDGALKTTTTEYISVPHSTDLDGFSEFSIVVRLFYIDSEANGFLVGKSSIYQLYSAGTSDTIGGSISGILVDTDTGVGFDINAWQTIAMVYDGAACRWYKNGILVHTEAGLSGATLSFDSIMTINAFLSGANQIDGLYDYVLLANKAYSDAKIAELSSNIWSLMEPIRIPIGAVVAPAVFVPQVIGPF